MGFNSYFGGNNIKKQLNEITTEFKYNRINGGKW